MMGSSVRTGLHAGVFAELQAVLVGALAEVLEFGLEAQKAVLQLGVFGGQPVALGGDRFKRGGRIDFGLIVVSRPD